MPQKTCPGPSGSLQAWESWIQCQHPLSMDLGLERVDAVYQALGRPRPGKKIVVVAGTNGKGSTAIMLAAMAREAGQSNALYTSPHLICFSERFRIQGQAVAAVEVVAALHRVEEVRRQVGVGLTYFEYSTLAAIILFAAAAVDVAIMEVGLGGRLDAVNVLSADLAILTRVALDHQDWLGNDRAAIAAEKVAVADHGCPLVHAVPDLSVLLASVAVSEPIRASCLGDVFAWWSGAAEGWGFSNQTWDYPELPLPALVGAHQRDNAALAIQAAWMLDWSLDKASLSRALLHVAWPGRQQYLRHKGVPVWLDVAHNPDAVRSLLPLLRSYSGWHVVIAVLADKDLAAILGLLQPHVAVCYPCRTEGERSRSEQDWQRAWNSAALPGKMLLRDDAQSAFMAARQQAGDAAPILVVGGFACVAAVLNVCAE